MSPITLFDKSFLQSLSLDESIWFDHYFVTNAVPVFYVETLADLSKPVRSGRTPEEEVRIIADKFPEMGGMPCSHHTTMCRLNPLGHRIPMSGQIPVSDARLVHSGGRPGAVVRLPPEAEAFSRWKGGEFLEVERLFARDWRSALCNVDVRWVEESLRTLKVESKSCRNLEDASNLAAATVRSGDRRSGVMPVALQFFNVPRDQRHEIRTRWRNAGYPALSEYAPYAAFVLTVELFFDIALAANLVSSARASNRVDIAYLFYLPFCMVFTSSDKLHQRCAPLFLRNDQEFVLGSEFKRSLGRINEHHLRLPESERDKGVISFARELPQIDDALLDHFRTVLIPRYAEAYGNSDTRSQVNPPTVDDIRRMECAPPLSPEDIDFDPTGVDQFLVERRTNRIKGSWLLIPKTPN